MAAGDDGRAKTFQSVGLCDWLVKKCKALKIYYPTEVQGNVIGPILKGKDVIAIAKTGNGKTATFALPILQKLSVEPQPFFCLVVTPTRELSIQIKQQFDVLGSPINLNAINIMGGVDVVDQLIATGDSPHILISTPGRLASFIRNKSEIDLSVVKFFVIDEADRILDDGFGADMATIIEALPKSRQTLLFTATKNKTIDEIIENNTKESLFVWAQQTKSLTVESLTQNLVLCPAYAKDVYFVYLLDKFLDEKDSHSVMVFSNSCKNCKLIGLILDKLNIKNVTLHSGMKQKDRVKALSKFKSNLIRVIISTDIASRGLDIPAVDLVVNHNIPFRPKDYLHRVGRTARAGREGKALSLVTPFDVSRIEAIESLINFRIEKIDVDEEKISEIFNEVALARRESERELDEIDFKQIDLKASIVTS